MLNKKIFFVCGILTLFCPFFGMQVPKRKSRVRIVVPAQDLPYEFDDQMVQSRALPTITDSLCNAFGRLLESCCGQTRFSYETRLPMAQFLYMRELNIRLLLAHAEEEREVVTQSIARVQRSYEQNEELMRSSYILTIPCCLLGLTAYMAYATR